MIRGEKDTHTEDSEEIEGAGHIQIGDMSMDFLNFSDFQFHQREGTSTSWSTNQDRKSLLLDTGSTFSCINN